MWAPGGVVQTCLPATPEGGITLITSSSSTVPSKAVPSKTAEGLLALPLSDFTQRFAKALPALVRFVLGDALRQHPKWGRLIPYSAEPYGTLPSLGHVCRPDIILTAEGPKICEMDFVASGRGWLLASLPGRSDHLDFLQGFADWYASMGVDRACYATGTVTECRSETQFFAQSMRENLDFDITAVNIDAEPVAQSALIDRLFYRSELAQPLRLGSCRVVTAEPWLDSKMIFAMLHDPLMTDSLTESIGKENLAFLRSACIESYPLKDALSHPQHESLGIRDRSQWVLKATDVEKAWSWGSRSVVLGRTRTQDQWLDYLRGARIDQNLLGRRPILQRFTKSLDFASVWNEATQGRLATSDPTRFGKGSRATSHLPARHPVTGRLGFFFPVSHGDSRTFTPRLGTLCLRQNPLTHMTDDAMSLAFRLSDEAHIVAS